MQTNYGHISWQCSPHETKANVSQMMAALADCPWSDGGMIPIAVQDGGGLLAGQGAGELGRTPARPLYCDGLTVAADLRLDNRGELLAALDIDPAQGHTLSDPELLRRAYRRWGIDCPSHLLGDFAFAIWDEGDQSLFCARDFVGARPFYYHHEPGQGFAWASDLRALLAHPQIPRQLNLAYVKAHLQTAMGQFQHPAHTFYANVEKLPPAHALRLDRSGLRTWAYWQPGQKPERRYDDEADYAEEVRHLLQEAVACRLGEPVHGVGAHLSGGLDSSSVAVMAHRHMQTLGSSATGFSWAPPHAVVPSAEVTNADDERPLADAVAQAAGLSLHYTTLRPDHLTAYAGRDVTVQPTTTLQLELAASADAAGLGIRTLLSGWGGDELLVFNGRGYFADLFRRGRWRTLQREFEGQRRIHGGASIWKPWVTRGLFPQLPPALADRLDRDPSPPPTLPANLRPDFAAALADVEPLTRPELRERPGVRAMQIGLLNHGHIPYRLESWAAHGATLGITYAYPLLDRRIVEFALSIPDYLFFKDGWKRYLYRTAMEGILPDRVRWHRVKEDPAMATQSRRVYKQVQPALRAQLGARADNPFVDVEALVSAQDAVAEQLESALAGDDQRAMRRAIHARHAAAGGAWLAFVDPAATV